MNFQFSSSGLAASAGRYRKNQSRISRWERWEKNTGCARR
jgi:hypothetical protein